MITAILNVYRRPGTLKEQVEALKKQTIPPKNIWIWQNKAPEKTPLKIPKKCMLVKSNFNFMYHGRFALALLAQNKTEYVAIFDDDIIPGEKWFENCIESMKKKEGLYVGVGRRLFVGYKGEKWVGWRNEKAFNDNIVEVDYGGHAWFFKTDWLRYFWMERQISMTNAEDIQLSFALQKNAGLNTYVPPHPKENKDLWSNVAGWKYGREKVASHKNPATGVKRKEWIKERVKIREICREKGWKLVQEKEGDKND